MPTMFLALAGAALLLVIYRIIRQTLFDPLKDIPIAPQAPFHKRLLEEPDPKHAEHWAHTIPNNGLIRYRGRLNQQRLLMTSPQVVHEVLVAQPYAFRRPAFVAKVLRSILGEGVFVAEGDTHKAQRRLMQQPFKPLRIKNLYPTFDTKSAELGDVLDETVSSESKSGGSVTLDIAAYIRRSTLDVIGLAGFGLDFAGLRNPKSELFQQYVSVFEPAEDVMRFRILTHILPAWLVSLLPLQCNKDLEAALSVIKRYIKGAITSRDGTPGSGEKAAVKTGSEASGDDVIGVLMRDGGVHDMDVLVDQSMNMLGAGHDTVYGAMVCAIFELSKRPAMQARLREEIRSAMEADATTAGDIDSLPYLAAFCNEVYRYWPPVPNIRRESIVPLNIMGYNIPPGVVFVHSYRLFHRSLDLWESDPREFDPERWVKDHVLGGARDKKAFASFGLGPRACIGEKFARAEVKHLVAMLVGRFDISFVGTGLQLQEQDLRLEYDITTKFIGGLAVQLSPVSV